MPPPGLDFSTSAVNHPSGFENVDPYHTQMAQLYRMLRLQHTWMGTKASVGDESISPSFEGCSTCHWAPDLCRHGDTGTSWIQLDPVGTVNFGPKARAFANDSHCILHLPEGSRPSSLAQEQLRTPSQSTCHDSLVRILIHFGRS